MKKSNLSAKLRSPAHRRGPSHLQQNAPKSVFIHAGAFKHFPLATPVSGTHPMGSRERLALFNMLDISDQTVLDLFAGSGALGFTALSLGAKSVTLVDANTAALRANLSRLQTAADCPRRPAIIQTDALFFRPSNAFDTVFVDPPYDHPEYFAAKSLQTYANFVKPGGTLVISRPKNLSLPSIDTLKPLKTRVYAALALDIFQKV